MGFHDTGVDNASPIHSKTGSRKVVISSEIVVVFIITIILTMYHLLLRGPVSYWLVIIPVVGFCLSLTDSSIGMGYGTIGSPLLIVLGFSSKLVVPSILVSQLVSAVIASTLHQKQGNVNYFDIKRNDTGIVFRLIVFGLIGTAVGAFLAIQLSKIYLNTYVGLLVISMGLVLLLKPKLPFSWFKVNLISLISGFNKAMSGGGYGPVATTGLVVTGNPIKNSVGATLFSVIFINTTSFVIYLLTKSITSLQLPLFLTICVLIGSQIGPRITGRMSASNVAKVAFASVSVVMGALTVFLTFVS
ncbi:MAG: sulfite exporter TauE/SafE family protein [Thermoplasmata archaeon]